MHAVTSWQIYGKTMETVRDFIFGGSKITAYGDCIHEIKICLLLGRKAMINLDSILKSRDITLSTKVHRVKAMVFPVVMYGCESWTIKKAESWRIDVFELWCWRRLLRVPWTTRRSNQSILKEILNIHRKDWCWSWNSNTLATWCEKLTHWERPWYWKRMKVGGEGDDRRWDGWMASLTWWTWVWASSGSWWWTGKPGVLQSMGSQRVRHDWVTELNWLACVCAQLLSHVQLFCNSMDYSPRGSSVHGISWARILEWVAISFSRGSSPPREWTRISFISCIGRQILYCWAI